MSNTPTQQQSASEFLPCEWCKQSPETSAVPNKPVSAVRCSNRGCPVRSHGWTTPSFWNESRVRADVGTGEAVDNDGIERILITVLGECPAAARLRAGEQSRGTSDVRAIIIATLSAAQSTVAGPTEDDVSQNLRV